MATIKDVAKEAGVSIATVSYVFNKSKKISEQTKARVLTAAEKIGYFPNGAARTMKVKSRKIVGAFLDDYSGYFYGELIQGMKTVLKANGYELVVCSGEKSHRLLLDKSIDGAIVLERSFTDEDLMNHANNGYKIVTLDRKLGRDNISEILLDNRKGARLAIEQIRAQGLNQVYVITGPESTYDSNERRVGAREEGQKTQMGFVEIEGNFTKECGYEAAQRIFKEATDEKVGIFCLNDEMAIGVYNYLKETNSHEVGKDVFLVGFDNIELAAYIMPRLTTIDYSAYKWGSYAAKSMLNMIENERVQNDVIDVEMVKGGSC